MENDIYTVQENNCENGKIFWSDEQEQYINSLNKANDTGCVKYFNNSMSIRKFAIVHECYNIGEEYAKQITSVDLSDQQSEVVLYGYLRELNVFEQVKAGESLDNLKLLIDLVANGDVEIRSFFDETGEYIDYDRILDHVNIKLTL